MKLDAKEFKRFKELTQKMKSGKISSEEKEELAQLTAKRNDKGSNDISWWKNYPELVKDVVNFPFNWIPGTRVTVTNPSLNEIPLYLGVIAVAKIAPAIGSSASDADPFNSQIRQLWIDMHRKYRGIGNYEKSDLGIAILAINSLFETIAKFERIYGVINTYHIGNRVVPNGLKDALGISDDLEKNLADFRYTINLFISKVKQLCLPKGLSILMSDIVAISNLFKDSENRRAFIYCFDTNDFGTFNGKLTNTGGTAIGSAVEFEDFDINFMNDSTPSGFGAFTVKDVYDILQQMVDALLNDDDIQLMCSDLLAAYGPENVMTLLPLPEDYRVEPVHDYERSIQFHNLSVVGRTASVYESNVIDVTMANSFVASGKRHVYYQYNNMVQCQLAVVSSQAAANYITMGNRCVPESTASTAPEYYEYGKNSDLLFDTWVDQPGETELMCGTRYSALCGTTITTGTGKFARFVQSYGSKVVETLEVWYYRPNSNDYFREVIYGTVIEDSRFNSQKDKFLHLAQMDWAPIFYINDSGDYTLLGDVDNFTKISGTNLERLHEVALLSGYKISMISKE